MSARLGEQAPTLWEAYDGWLRRATSVIGDSADALNAINVFPVPDADTGSNLKLTMTGISQAVPNLEQASLDLPFRRRSCPRTATPEPSSPRCSSASAGRWSTTCRRCDRCHAAPSLPRCCGRRLSRHGALLPVQSPARS